MILVWFGFGSAEPKNLGSVVHYSLQIFYKGGVHISQKKFGLKSLANNNRGRKKMQSADQIYSFMKNFVGGISSSSTFADRLDFRV